jgi:hypothetical protein
MEMLPLLQMARLLLVVLHLRLSYPALQILLLVIELVRL